MAESPNPDIDLTKNSVRAKCPTEGCPTSVSVHVSMRDQIQTYQCRKHALHLVVDDE